MITLPIHSLVRPLADLRSLFGDDDVLPCVRLTSGVGMLYIHLADGRVRLRAEAVADGVLPDDPPVTAHLGLLHQAAIALFNQGCMDKVTLSVTEQGHLTLSNKRSRIRLNHMCGRELSPPLDWPESGTPVEMEPHVLRSLGMVMRAADEEANAPLCCVRLSPGDGYNGRMVIEALNGHIYRRAVVDAPFWAGLLPEQGILVPRSALGKHFRLIRLFLVEPTPLATLTDKALILRVPGFCLSLDLCRAPWIDTDKFRRRALEAVSTITCKTEALRNALRVMEVVSNEHSRAVLLTKSGKHTIRLRGGSNQIPGRAETTIHNAFWTGHDDSPPPVDRIAFPASMLLDWLRDCPATAKVNIRLSGEEGPAFFACEAHKDYECIIMPMKVADDDWFGEDWK